MLRGRIFELKTITRTDINAKLSVDQLLVNGFVKQSYSRTVLLYAVLVCHFCPTIFVALMKSRSSQHLVIYCHCCTLRASLFAFLSRLPTRLPAIQPNYQSASEL